VAFARTFARVGRIALTPLSEQVEGFSSLSWFLIQAGAARTGLSAADSILVSQALAAICAVASVALMIDLGRRLDLKPHTLAAVAWMFALAGPLVTETAAGMEMGLLCLSGLTLVRSLYFKRNLALALGASAIFLTTRFESCLYYAFLITPLALRREFRTFAGLAAFGLSVFAAEEAWRWTLFGDWMPNTVRAKMQPAYSPHSGLSPVLSRLNALGELGAGCSALLGLVAIMAMILPRPAPRTEPSASRHLWLAVISPIVAVEAFALIGGRNSTGPLGRMQLLALPFLLLVIGRLFDRLSEPLPDEKRRLLAMTCAVVSLSVGWFLSPVGTAMAVFAPPNLFAFVTPASMQLTGQAADRVRTLLGQPQLTFMTPDLGGVGLCCDRLRVVDLALLANGRLARRGYQDMAAVLDLERPDVIEAHGAWSKESRLTSLSGFSQRYTPALVDGTRLYVRNDHVAALLSAGASWCSLLEGRCAEGALRDHRGDEKPPLSTADDLAFLRGGRFLDLPHDQAAGARPANL
jgi:hypothetical protein